MTDSHYWVDAHHQGVHFPAGLNHLNGARALIFARTRKGDNDYERARRQQLLVAAAVAKVKNQGLAAVPALISLARGGGVKTDLPLASVGAIYEIVAKADLGTGKRAVLGPRSVRGGDPRHDEQPAPARRGPQADRRVDAGGQAEPEPEPEPVAGRKRLAGGQLAGGRRSRLLRRWRVRSVPEPGSVARRSHRGAPRATRAR